MSLDNFGPEDFKGKEDIESEINDIFGNGNPIEIIVL